MSQERTRFPTQPKDVRRSATSNKDVAVPGAASRNRGPDQDKPSGPPPRPRSAVAKDEGATDDQAGDQADA
jgi:hypothetical protein